MRHLAESDAMALRARLSGNVALSEAEFAVGLHGDRSERRLYVDSPLASATRAGNERATRAASVAATRPAVFETQVLDSFSAASIRLLEREFHPDLEIPPSLAHDLFERPGQFGDQSVETRRSHSFGISPC